MFSFLWFVDCNNKKKRKENLLLPWCIGVTAVVLVPLQGGAFSRFKVNTAFIYILHSLQALPD